MAPATAVMSKPSRSLPLADREYISPMTASCQRQRSMVSPSSVARFTSPCMKAMTQGSSFFHS